MPSIPEYGIAECVADVSGNVSNDEGDCEGMDLGDNLEGPSTSKDTPAGPFDWFATKAETIDTQNPFNKTPDLDDLTNEKAWARYLGSTENTEVRKSYKRQYKDGHPETIPKQTTVPFLMANLWKAFKEIEPPKAKIDPPKVAMSDTETDKMLAGVLDHVHLTDTETTSLKWPGSNKCKRRYDPTKDWREPKEQL
jgi:hypothetical protein